MQILKHDSVKPFFYGLSVSILLLVGFFAGAIADRLFVVKPLDFLMERSTAQRAVNGQSSDQPSLLSRFTDESKSISIPDVASEASRSVVTLSARSQQRIVEPGNLFDFGPFSFRRPQTQLEEVQRDIGTGFVVDENLIVTNRHVVSDPQITYLVVDKEGNEYEVDDIYRDPANDLAFLQVSGLEAPSLPLGDSETIRVGEQVIAIGTALGEFRHTVTTGVVSGLGRGIQAGTRFGGRVESLENVIQTDAAINPGNSGGPLIDATTANVIGVNVAVSAQGENVGFAIPINVVKSSIQNFNETGQFDRPFMGVRYQLITEQAALLNEVPQGAYVLEVIPGSTADQADIQQGDIIVKFDGRDISDEENLAELINQYSIGDSVSVEVWRDGQTQTLQLQLRGSGN